MTRYEFHRKKRIETGRREAEVLRLLVEGATNAEIGAELGMAPRTVKKYCARFYRRHEVAHLPPACKRSRLAVLVAPPEPSETAAELEPIERIVAASVTLGKTNAEIGAMFGRKRCWAVNLLREIYLKTGMENRTGLAMWAAAKLAGRPSGTCAG